jgi:hypothetical protein
LFFLGDESGLTSGEFGELVTGEVLLLRLS